MNETQIEIILNKSYALDRASPSLFSKVLPLISVGKHIRYWMLANLNSQ